MENALKDLKNCVGRAQQVCGSLEIEATADVIEVLQNELEEFRVAANSFDLKPLPGETPEQASLQLTTASKSVGSTVTQLLTAAAAGDKNITSVAARDTANALRDFTAAVRGVAATTKDRAIQNKIINQAQLVMSRSATLVLEAQRAMQNPSDSAKQENLYSAGKAVTVALSGAMGCLPGQEEVEETMNYIATWSQQIDSGNFRSSGRPYGELQGQLTNAADKLSEATTNVVQSAPRPEQLATSSKQFGQVLGDVMECSMDMAAQTTVESVRSEMIITMKNVTTSSSTLLSSAKTVAADPNAPHAKNNLANAARLVQIYLDSYSG